MSTSVAGPDTSATDKPVAHLYCTPTGCEPLRGELYGPERLELHARQLGQAGGEARVFPGAPLLREFQASSHALVQAHRHMSESYQRQETLGTEAEWLLDNFHIVADALREIQNDLPAGFYRRLPKLVRGELAGYPRVYALALEFIAHCDANLNEVSLTHFVQIYQSVTPLRIGELWAIPVMLRLVLADNVRRIAEQVLETRSHGSAAQSWAKRCLPPLTQSDRADQTPYPDLPPDCHDHFILEVLEHVRDQRTHGGSGLEWLEGMLAKRGLNTADVLRRARQNQAANQVSIGNCINSLRLLATMAWPTFFERTSLVEEVLREDPTDTYGRQDFATRDRCRKMIERLALGSGMDELQVARLALQRAQEEADRAAKPRNLVSYYLIGDGARELERQTGFVAPLRERGPNLLRAHPALFYFGSIVLLTAALVAGVTAVVGYIAAPVAIGKLVWTAVAALLPASEVAVALTNWLTQRLVPPRTLAKMDFKNGLPADCATFVVIPALLAWPDHAQRLVDNIEVHYLSNPDPNVWFALLTDFADASSEERPEDDDCVRAALEGIRSLNQRYCPEGQPRFFLFHRRRLWNPAQGCWMGWERKRGKLSEFNRLLRGDQNTSFTIRSGDVGQLPHIRFVITLDADTRLPRETARQLVAALGHPLNEARLDREQGRVVNGYALLQPRIGLTVRAARRTWFARILAGSIGIDPYITAVSDVYQDLFGAGSFTGKGIYEVDSFQAATGDTFPENHILSHDLIEGNYARCGLVSDIELFEEFPPHYAVYARREHRWVRGDWQILPWLLPYVPSARGRRTNPLPLLERWKILDNLRRSLLPPVLVLILILGWTALPGAPWVWTAFAALVLAFPVVLLMADFLLRLPGAVLRGKKPPLPPRFAATAGQAALLTAFLCHQAWLMVDAIGRTLWRLLVTRRKLLEWESAAVTESRADTSLRGFCRSMWSGPAVAATMIFVLAVFRPLSLVTAWPFLLGWLLSPLIAYGVSRPRVPPPAIISAAERRTLRRLARRTWSFFEDFVGPGDHWLPPDNFQEDPKGEVAHRTSPTNIGLYLVSTLAAHDLGYLTFPALLDRLEKTLTTLEGLERSHGHIYNWYDTATLKPLQPPYISTVDSGNLLAALLVVRHGLEEIAAKPFEPEVIRQGLVDTLELLMGAFQSLEPSRDQPQSDILRNLDRTLADVQEGVHRKAASETAWAGWLQELEQAAGRLHDLVAQFSQAVEAEPKELKRWLGRFTSQVRQQREKVDGADSAARCGRLMERLDAFAHSMDFRFLFDPQRQLFSVGYNLAQGRLDHVHYDLLASEASLASYVAIARGEVPLRHWFQLGRPITRSHGAIALLSWSGTMFEYLMPRLFFRSTPDTLLDESQRAAVARQIAYGRQRRVPWGISESAFNALDANLVYQYQAFGVPGLGFKRGLVKDLVIAPYATVLALGVVPGPALRNLERLTRAGGLGPYGFYDALDYTRDRVPPQEACAVVKCFMAHHQGMAMIALTNFLLDDVMPRRFHANPVVRAAELLLQERVPHGMPIFEPHREEAQLPPPANAPAPHLSRRLETPFTPQPHTHLLSNGRYSVMISAAGSGSSWCNGLDVTRWREDVTRDCWGQFCYIRDRRSQRVWCTGYQPLCGRPEGYAVVFAADRAELRRRDGHIETRLEVVVSPEDRAEVRRLTITNHDGVPHDLEVTSYAEVVLASRRDDLAHPAFAKLFLETEFLPTDEALLCRRRPRSTDQKPVWAVHVLALDGPAVGGLEFETDRNRFLGRGRAPANPQALLPDARLSGTAGPVLDPIFSLRQCVRVAADSSIELAFTTAVADSRDEALALADQYHDFHTVNRAFELAWAHAQLEMRQLHVSIDEAHLYQRIASHLFFPTAVFRAASGVLTANRQGVTGLWRHGISGDYPIVLVWIGAVDELLLVRQLLAAHAFWRGKGLVVDLVIVNEHESGYFEELHQELQTLVRGSEEGRLLDKPGGIFLRKSAQLAPEDKVLFQAAARCIFSGKHGALARQVARLEPTEMPQPVSRPRRQKRVPARSRGARPQAAVLHDLIFTNDDGGFTRDGREYHVLPALEGDLKLPPAPWVNVVANPSFGFVITEAGAGYTWAGNSQSNRLTPWSNDPVCDPPGEALYLRDDADGETWSVTPSPLGRAAALRVRHGQGYTRFEQESRELRQELLLFVPPEDSVKVIQLTVRNQGRRTRRLTATFYAEWVLGTVRENTAMHVVTEVDRKSGALLAANAFNPDFGTHVAFADVDARPRSYTTDRTEFLGRNGSLAVPAGLQRSKLSGATGAALDPCVVLQAPFTLEPDEERTLTFFLGQAETSEQAGRLLENYKGPGRLDRVFQDVRDHWDGLLTAVQVHTPNPALDVLLNRWLLYQVLSCRLWGRTGFYQSAGAYGFRDQLQDVLALIYAAPAETRAHILRAASRQFAEGDVQHWWHPPKGAGVRTRFSDDFLWLPFAVCQYVTITGDVAILEEQVPFLEAPPLRPDQEDDYRVPEISAATASLYEHCLRAVDHGCRFGAHGLPLMGSGDWNDGMNRVGSGGKGESVWNGWFLLTIFRDLLPLMAERGDGERAQRYRAEAERLRQALEEHAWDGRWYRRAYFDDGTPLGSAENAECQIDSLPQTWAVISGAARPERARQAFDEMLERLVRADEQIVKLFTPPFGQSSEASLEPGYVKGYVPGIRENGGQYTHAATWVVKAAAMLGRGTMAERLLSFLNPIEHTTPQKVERYRVEPYVLAGDVAGEPPHTGRGGWTWYTGSAGWLYRVVLEDILGVRRRGKRLFIEPCIPAAWRKYAVTLRHGGSTYHIEVENPDGGEHGVREIVIDGKTATGNHIDLVDDGKNHEIRVTMAGPRTPSGNGVASPAGSALSTPMAAATREV